MISVYLQAKYEQAQAQRRAILPQVRSECDLTQHNLHLSPLHRTNTEFDLQNHFTIVPTDRMYSTYKHIPDVEDLQGNSLYIQTNHKQYQTAY